MEQTRSAGAQQSSVDVPSLGPVDVLLAPVVPLAQLAQTAREVPGKGGGEAVAKLHAALEQLTASPEHGELLVSLLDAGAFHGLKADDGRWTRELAVETLLGLGYPWALRIHPDELSWYRAVQARIRRIQVAVVLAIVGLGGVAALYLFQALATAP